MLSPEKVYAVYAKVMFEASWEWGEVWKQRAGQRAAATFLVQQVRVYVVRPEQGEAA